jgi:hypothetical protein
VFWKLVDAVVRRPGESIRVVFNDYGPAFCAKGGLLWLTKALMLQLRHRNIQILGLHHFACEPYFPVAMGIWHDSYFVFKPGMDSEKELRHVKQMPHGLDTSKNGQFQTVRRYATRAVDGSMEGGNRNTFIVTKLDGLEYFSWRNTGTKFHCHQLTMPPNVRAVGGSPFDKVIVIGKDGMGCMPLFSMCMCVCHCFLCVCVCNREGM